MGMASAKARRMDEGHDVIGMIAGPAVLPPLSLRVLVGPLLSCGRVQ